LNSIDLKKLPLEAIIYDMDGTLVHTEPIALKIMREVLVDFDVELTHSDEQFLVGKAWPWVLSELKQHKSAAFNPDEVYQRISKLYNEKLNEMIPEMPGAVESVHQMSRRFPLGLVSGSYQAQIIKILAKLLEILVCPTCKGPLEHRRAEAELVCRPCRVAYAIKDANSLVRVADSGALLSADG
jgi:ribosomal protein L37AE/L43A